jgi:hypothetical protein
MRNKKVSQLPYVPFSGITPEDDVLIVSYETGVGITSRTTKQDVVDFVFNDTTQRLTSGVTTNQITSFSGNSTIEFSTNEITLNQSLIPKVDNQTDIGTPIKRFRNVNTVSGSTTFWSASVEVQTPLLNLGNDSQGNSRIITANNSVIQSDTLFGGGY